MYGGATEDYVCVLANDGLGSEADIWAAQIGKRVHVQLAWVVAVEAELCNIFCFFKSGSTYYE